MDRRAVLIGLQIGAGLFPAAASFVGFLTCTHSIFILSAFFLVITVCVLPLFFKRANLWAFVFVTLWSIPLNIYIISKLHALDVFFYDSVFMNALVGIFCFCVLFSIEQIMLGTMTVVLRNVLKK